MKNQLRPPRLVLGGVYSRQDVINNLGVGPDTLAKWCRKGLRHYLPGTNQHYFLADDIVEFWRQMDREKAKR